MEPYTEGLRVGSAEQIPAGKGGSWIPIPETRPLCHLAGESRGDNGSVRSGLPCPAPAVPCRRGSSQGPGLVSATIPLGPFTVSYTCRLGESESQDQRERERARARQAAELRKHPLGHVTFTADQEVTLTAANSLLSPGLPMPTVSHTSPPAGVCCLEG